MVLLVQLSGEKIGDEQCVAGRLGSQLLRLKKGR